MNTHLTPLPRWACILLAVLTATIGLAASYVTMEFFIIGLQRAEQDSLAKDALIAAGVLMIITELAAFGLAALLPAHQLKALRWRLIACGMLLLAFEAATIYVTQVTLVKSSEAMAGSVLTRIADLRTSIESRRASAAGLRQNGAQQSVSIFAASRAAGAESLRRSIEIDQQIEPLAAELAHLQAGKTATLTDVLGKSGMLIYSVSRAMLISVMGLVMFGAAGALLRSLRTPTATVAPVAPTSYRQAETVAPKNAPAGIAFPRSFAAAGLPLAAMAAPMAYAAPAAPHVPVTVPSQAHSSEIEQSHLMEPKQSHLAALAADGINQAHQVDPVKRTQKRARVTTSVPDGAKIDAGTTGKAATRYNRIKAAVQAGELKPSIRAIQAAEGGGGIVVRRYLHQLEADGVTVRAGLGWALTA